MTLVGSFGLLYSRRKGWPLEDAVVQATLELPKPGGEATARIVQRVDLRGPLDDAQRARLLQIAGRCPVHRLLERPAVFEEMLVETTED